MIKIEDKGNGAFEVHMDIHFKLLVKFMALELKLDYDYLLGRLLEAAVDKSTTVHLVERDKDGVEG